MRSSLIFAVLLVLVSCTKKESLSTIGTDSTVNVQTTGNAVNTVASDQELLRQALVLADSKGTLQNALTAAAQDSLIGIKMRTALILGNEAKARTSAPIAPGSASGAAPGTAPSTKSHKATTTKKTSSTSTNGDVIDKANTSVDKANQEIDKAGTLLDKSREASKKAGDILNGKR